MTRIAIMPYGPSDSVNLLRDDLTTDGHSVIKMKRENSRFRPRASDMIINWGSSRDFNSGDATLLNNPSAVNLASNKISCLTELRNHDVETINWTTDRAEAVQWVADGALVFCRTELRGHSGSGIVCVSQEQPDDLGNVEWRQDVPTAPLYTLGIGSRHREYRVHVMKGEVLFIQQKRRANGYQDNPNYSNVVRNHGNGWIYSHLNMTAPNQACINSAVRAVDAVGLDFGAVDVITNGNDAWVLEINTAPGLSGETTRARYARAFSNIKIDLPVLEGLESQFSSAEIRAARVEEPAEEVVREEGVPVRPRPRPDAPSQEAPRASVRPNGAGLQHDRFYVIDIEGVRDIAWYDGNLALFFVAKGFGSFTNDQVTVIREVEV